MMNSKLPIVPAGSASLETILASAPLLVLTGAGISVGAGIPTYRDERGVWLRSDPIKHQEFIGDSRQRQRYWGRSTIGWPAVRDAVPSPAHLALAALERLGLIEQLVTQNVDRLHQRAGSEKVIDLHGRMDQVLCLGCGDQQPRDALQACLLALNPGLNRTASAARPDGDADLSEHDVDAVVVPDCTRCGGMLMPDVVFFGGSIPPTRVSAGEAALTRAGALVVVGSSLQVYSGYRFCRWAERAGKPIYLINPGQSRADSMAAARFELDANHAMEALLDCAQTPAAFAGDSA